MISSQPTRFAQTPIRPALRFGLGQEQKNKLEGVQTRANQSAEDAKFVDTILRNQSLTGIADNYAKLDPEETRLIALYEQALHIKLDAGIELFQIGIKDKCDVSFSNVDPHWLLSSLDKGRLHGQDISKELELKVMQIIDLCGRYNAIPAKLKTSSKAVEALMRAKPYI